MIDTVQQIDDIFIESGKKQIYRIHAKNMLVYLACPYMHDDEDIREERFWEVTKATAYFTSRGVKVFSPITHCHPMAKRYKLPGTWEFWREYDETFLVHCNKMYILTIDGWRISRGVKEEISICRFGGIPIFLVDPETYVVSYFE